MPSFRDFSLRPATLAALDAMDIQSPTPIQAQAIPALLEGLAQAKRREFASDAEVEAAFRRFDP